MIIRSLSAFSITEYLLYTVLLVGITVILKYVLSRRSLSIYLPGNQISIFDLWADAKYVAKNKAPKYANYSSSYVLQMMRGFAQLYRKDSFFTIWFGFTPFINLVKADAVEQVISGTKNMEKGLAYKWAHPWVNTGLLTSHGQKWKTRRRLLTPAFHFDILKDFIPVFNEQGQILIDTLKPETKSDWVDITRPVTMCTLDIICETTLGVKVNAQKNRHSKYVEAILGAASNMIERMVNPLYLSDFIYYNSEYGKNFMKYVKILHEFTRSVIAQKKAQILKDGVPTGKRKALMDLLLVHHLENNDLSEEDIREEVDTFTFEGHDTTSMGISWAIYMIGLYKDVQEQLHEEMDRIFGDDVERPVTTDDIKDMEYLDRVLKESQRLYPSVPTISRTSSNGTTINGYNIPDGTECTVFIYELHRDPDVFPNPEVFDPNRFLPENTAKRNPYAYIPFSAGSRNCIGQRFAIMEEKIVVSHLLRNFRFESVEPRDKVVPTNDVILRNTLPLKIRIRNRRE